MQHTTGALQCSLQCCRETPQILGTRRSHSPIASIPDVVVVNNAQSRAWRLAIRAGVRVSAVVLAVDPALIAHALAETAIALAMTSRNAQQQRGRAHEVRMRGKQETRRHSKPRDRGRERGSTCARERQLLLTNVGGLVPLTHPQGCLVQKTSSKPHRNGKLKQTRQGTTTSAYRPQMGAATPCYLTPVPSTFLVIVRSVADPIAKPGLLAVRVIAQSRRTRRWAIRGAIGRSLGIPTIIAV